MTAHAGTDEYRARWGLEADGREFSTPSSTLAPVRYRDEPAMLKIATVPEETAGNRLMIRWAGRGAARVLEHDGAAILLERATGDRSLASMAENGEDDAATRILCEAANRLHRVIDPPPAGLRTLVEWFGDLFVHAEEAGGFFADAASIAEPLLAGQREIVVLHGDIHHGNVLDFGDRGWLAIDPKHIIGDRAFDFTNILCNPSAEMATRPGRLSRQIEVIADAAALEGERLLRWTVAWCALSAAWWERSGQPGGHALILGREALRMLEAGRSSS